MSKYKELVGKKFGRLTLEALAGEDPGRSQLVRCLCDCGNIITTRGRSLISGNTVSCGCSRILDMTGNKYGELTVKRLHHRENAIAFWECICSCGNTHIATGANLRTGNTKSCGCSKGKHIHESLLKRPAGTKYKYHRSKYPGRSLGSRNLMENIISRKLTSLETVHHIDGNTKNNTQENLMLFNTGGAHVSFHALLRYLKGKKLFITGCGTFTKEILRILSKSDCCERIAVYSRNEYNQALTSEKYPEGGEKGVRYFIGDCCDYTRLKTAMAGYDICIHASAMKRIDACAYNPTEAIKNNITASQNVFQACVELDFEKCLYISTDKSTGSTLYGQTKGVAEKLAISYNNIGHKCRFSVCKYPNVFRSRGSVFELWDRLYIAGEPLPITDMRMTRMWVTIEEALQFVLTKLLHMQGGEIFIPDVKGELLIDTAKRMYPGATFKEIGLRTSERLHESMLSDVDGQVYKHKRRGFYAIFPQHHDWIKNFNLKQYTEMPADFTLNSCTGITPKTEIPPSDIDVLDLLNSIGGTDDDAATCCTRR